MTFNAHFVLLAFYLVVLRIFKETIIENLNYFQTTCLPLVGSTDRDEYKKCPPADISPVRKHLLVIHIELHRSDFFLCSPYSPQHQCNNDPGVDD